MNPQEKEVNRHVNEYPNKRDRFFSIALNIKNRGHHVYRNIREKIIKQKEPTSFYHYSRESVHHHRHIIIVVLLVLALVYSTISGYLRASISELDFYPQACSGGWQNASQAEGEPQVGKNGDNFDNGNSAIIQNSLGEINCKGFKSEITEETIPQKINLKFSWNITDQLLAGTDNTVPQLLDDSNSSSVNILNNVIVSPEEKSQIPAVLDEVVPAEIIPTENIAPEVTPTETLDPVEPPVPVEQTFFQKRIIPYAYAQDSEVAPSTPVTIDTPPAQSETISAPDSSSGSNTATFDAIPEPASLPEPNTATDTIPDSIDAPINTELETKVEDSTQPKITAPASFDAPTETKKIEVAKIIQDDNVDIVEVEIRFDGGSWQSIGRVNRNNWRNASFNLMKFGVSRFEDLKDIEVIIKTLSTIDTPPVIYLDSMYIQTVYETLPPKDQFDKLPKISVLDQAINDQIFEGGESFNLDQDPTFVINELDLTTFEIAKLVEDKKVEVIDDSEGVIAQAVNINESLNNDIINENVAEGEDKSSESKIKELFQSIFNPNSDNVYQSSSIKDIINETKQEIKDFKEEPTDILILDANQPESQPTPAEPTSTPAPVPSEAETNAQSLETSTPITPEQNSPAPEVIPQIAPVESQPAPQESEGSVSMKSIFGGPLKAFAQGGSQILNIEVLDSAGKVTGIDSTIENVNVNGTIKGKVVIKKPSHQFRPGKYTLKLTVITDTAQIVSEQDFTWGVLVVNTDKTIYGSGENAYVQMGVIDDRGHTICAADLDMTIQTPSGIEHKFSTNTDLGFGVITRDSECGPDNYITTGVPDYHADFANTSEIGLYKIFLTANTKNGVKNIQDKFFVENDPMFSIQRVTASRIQPQHDYDVIIKVKSKYAFTGTVTEKVPDSFGIVFAQNNIPYDGVILNGEEKIIYWQNISFTAGEEKVLSYHYNAPDISPELFIIGEAAIYDSLYIDQQSVTPLYSEKARWEIASDGTPRYWVGGTGNWSDATNHWANASGGAPGVGNTPTAADNCIFDTSSSTANAAYTVTVDTSATCLDFTMGGPGSGNNVTWAGSSALAISGNMNLSAGTADLTRTYTGAITFNSVSSQTVTTGGVSMASSFSFTTAGSWQLQDALTTTGAISVTNGTFDTNNVSITASQLSSSVGGTTRTLSLGSSAITVTGTTPVQFINASGIIVSPNTSTITATAGSVTFNGGGVQTFYNVVLSGGGTSSVSGTNSFNNFTFTGAAAISDTLTFSGNQIFRGTLTLNGNSTINRALIQSSIIGTQLIFNANAVSLSYIDIMDIAGTGAAAPFTGTSLGNSLGNSGITFDTALDLYWKTTTTGSKNWSTVGNWFLATNGGGGAGRIPLPQDNAIFDSNSIGATSTTIIIDVPRAGKGVCFDGSTGCDGTTNVNSATNTPTIFYNSGTYLYGNLIFISGMNITGNSITWMPRNNAIIKSSGKTAFPGGVTINAPGGTITIQDDLVVLGNNITLTNGNFNANNFNVSAYGFSSNVSNARTITMGSGTWSITSATSWIVGATKLTLNSDTSTIKFTDTSNSVTSFSGGGLTYYNVWFARGASTASNTISSSNYFYELKDTGTAAHSMLFATGTTQTINSFTVSGSAGNLITLNVSTGTSTYNLVKVGGGTVSRDYLNIQHSIATPATTWYAGVNSTNNQATATAGSGWTFTAPPGGGCQATATGTWGGTDTANFTGCTGAASGGTGTGARPGAGDYTTINTGVTITLGANTAVLDHLIIIGSLTTSGTNYSISATNIHITSTGTLTANASTITLSGTVGVIFDKNSAGTFTYGTSSVVYTADAAIPQLTGGNPTTFYDLTLSPTLTAARAYTFGSGLVTVSHNFSSNPNGGGSSRMLTVNIGHDGMVTSGTYTVQGTSSGTTNVDTLNYPITLNTLTINSGSQFSPGSSDIILTGNTGTIITNTGTWAGGTGIYTLSGNGDATISSNTISLGTITISGTGVKKMGGNTTASGTLNINTGTFSLETFTLTLSGTTGFPFTAPVGTFSAATGTVSYTGTSTNGVTIIQTTGVTYYSLTMNGSGQTFNPNGNITGNAAGTLTLTNGKFDTTSNNYSITIGKISIANSSSAILLANASVVTLNAISGNLFTRGANGVFTQGTSEVKITSASGSPTLLATSGVTFHKLTIDSGATVINAGQIITMSNANSANKLYIKTGVLNDGGNPIVGTSNGTFVMDASTAFCVGGTAASTTATCDSGATSSGATNAFPSNYTNGNITFSTTSTVYYSANLAGMVVSVTPTYGNLYFNPVLTGGRGFDLAGALTVNGDLTINPSGTANLFTLNAGGDVTVASGKTTTIRRNVTPTSTFKFRPVATDYSLSTGKLNVDTGGTINFASAATGITLTGTSGTLFTLAGTYTITSSTGGITVSGNGDAIFNSGTPTIYDLTFTGTGVKTLGGNITNTHNMTVSAGTFDPTASYTVTGSGTNVLTVNTATIRSMHSTFAGDYISFETRTMNTNSIVDYFLGGTQTVDSTITYYDLSISTSGTKSLNGTTTAGGTTTISGGTLDSVSGSNYALNTLFLVISGGTFTPQASTVTISGTTGTLFAYSSGTFTAGTSTVTFSGNGTATLFSGSPSFSSLTSSGTGTKTVGGNVTISSALTISGGTFAGSSYTITLSGTGTVFNNTATYSAGTSLVKLTNNSSSLKTFIGGGSTFNNFWFAPSTGTGTLEIRGSNTFADFKDDGTVGHSILFTAGTTQTVTTFTVTGSGSGNKIIINSGDGAGSTSTSTHALTKSAGAIYNDYLNIQHSVATPASTWYAGVNSTNNQAVATAGSGWIFSGPPCVSNTTGNWNTGGNWTNCTGVGGIPAAADNVVVSSGHTITLDVNTPTVTSLNIAGTLDTSGTNYSVNAVVLNINTGGTLTANGSNINVTSGGTGSSRPFINDGTFTVGTSSFYYLGTSNTEVESTTYNHLIIYPASGTITYYLGTASSQTINVNNFEMNDAATLTVDWNTYDPAINIVGNLLLNSGTTFTKSASATMTFSPVGAKNITDTTSSKQDLGVLSISGGSSSPKVTITLDTKMTSMFIASGHEFDASNDTLTFTGNSGTILDIDSTGTFTYGTSTVVYTGDGNLTTTSISNYPCFYNLVLSPTLTADRTYSSGTYTCINNIMDITPTGGSSYKLTYSANAFNGASGDLNINPATSTYATVFINAATGNVFKKINISSRGELYGTGSFTIQFYGTSGTLFTNNGTFTAGASTVYYSSDASVTLFSGSFTGSNALYNLVMWPAITANRTYTGGAAVDIGNNFTMIPSDTTSSYTLTYTLGGIHNVTGDILVSDDGSYPAASAINTNGSGNYAINATNIFDSSTYGVTYTLNDSVVTLAGYWVDSSSVSVYNMGTSSVVFNTNSTISNYFGTAMSFYDLTFSSPTGKQIDFTPSYDPNATVEVTHTFTVTGTAGNLIKLYSQDPYTPTKWPILVSGTANVNYADIKDGGCDVSSVDIFTHNSVDSGNNDSCWVFNYVSFSISDNSVGFNNLSSTAARYATADGAGSASEVEAHNIVAATGSLGGYTLSVQGATMTRNGGAQTITAIGGSNTASSVGTEQFGIRATATGGTGAVSAPYAASGFAYDGVSAPDEIAGESVGDGVDTTYSIRYLGNISNTTDAGTYTTSLTYILTGNF